MPSIQRQRIPVPPDSGGVLPATDTPRYYWRVTFVDGAGVSWSVVVAANHESPEPQVLAAKQIVVVGLEQGVFALSRSTGEVVTGISDVTHVGWLEDLPDGGVLIAAEDQLLVVSADGALRWRQSLPDVIDDTTVETERVVVRVMSGETYAHDVNTGNSIPLFNR